MLAHLLPFFKLPGGRAIGMVFALCGFIFGTWASLIPYVKQKFILDEAQLGLLLLCMPLGTFIANPLAIFVMSRFGDVKTALFSLVLMGVAFALPIVAPHMYFVMIGLFFSGATFASTNVAMNTYASRLEINTGIKLMSACHGMWSLGAMFGALCSGPGIALMYSISPYFNKPHQFYMLALLLITFGIVWLIKKDFSKEHNSVEQNKNQRVSGLAMFKPNRTLWILISIIICTYITEGTMADWSTLYMRDMTDAPETIAGWGFAVYAFCMAAGRFLGDGLIAKYGSISILGLGGKFVLVGMTIIIISSSPWTALPGFMLTGFGISVASPILYAAAARVSGMPPGVGLATMNNFGMLAFLGGPVLIGFLAKALDLRMAFLVIVVAAIVWIAQTVMLRKKNIVP